jgi:hypothetical protein
MTTPPVRKPRAHLRAALASLAAAAAVTAPVIALTTAPNAAAVAGAHRHGWGDPHQDDTRGNTHQGHTHGNPHETGGDSSGGFSNHGLCCNYGDPNHNETAAFDDGL